MTTTRTPAANRFQPIDPRPDALPLRDFRTVTPYRSPSYTLSPQPLGIAASADSNSRSSNVLPVPSGK
jgi:hypothetical protein